jgi:hypothetical protein
MAYDEHIQRAVLFGGVTNPDASQIRYYLNDTWEWSGQRWVQIFTEQSPPGRSSHAMTYDATREQVILFGGIRTDNEYLGDTWAYRGRQWIQIQTPAAPSPRIFPGMTFDRLRERVFLFGGSDASGTLRDTWEFDGTAWTRLTDGPALLNPNILYDAKRNEILLLGLNDVTDATEMHRWTGNAWESITLSTSPQCANLGGLVYQQHNEKVLAVGGQCSNGDIQDEIWEWDGANWTELEPPVSHGALIAFAIAYDSARKQTVIFGGDSFGTSGSTLIYIEGTWRTLFDAFSPGPRSLAVFEFDPARNVGWLFGGRDALSDSVDLWRLSGNTWSSVIAPNAPTSCLDAVGDWDSDRGRLVIVCGDSSVHEWDGEAWTGFTTLTDKPEQRRLASAVYDPRSKTTILFGGYGLTNSYLRDTWSWNGTKWTRLGKDKAAPPSRSLGSLFYNPTNQRVLVFGGIGRNSQTATVKRYGDMWSFDGQSWVEIKSTTLPSARYGALVVWNPLTSRAILFGGKSAEERYLNDQWEWDGSNWTQVSPSNPPAERMNYGMLFDPTVQRFIMYGGYAGLYYSELWQFDGTRWSVQQAPFAGRRRGAGIVRPASGSGLIAPATPQD